MATSKAQVDQAIAKLLSDGAYAAGSLMPKRLVAAVSGTWGSGKTHLSLTAPEPITFFDVDKGTEGVVEKFVLLGKRVIVVPVNFPDQGNQQVYMDIWQKMMAQLNTALSMGQGTVVFDTFTVLRQLSGWAFVGKIAEIRPTLHAVYQAPLRAIVRLVYDSGMNGVFLHRYGEVFNEKGVMELKGWKDIEYECQVSVIVEFVPPDKDHPVGFYRGRVNKCRQKPSLVNTWLLSDPMAGGDLDFSILTQKVHG